MSDAFRSDELFACHIPAIELLVKLGYHFLTPEQALVARGGRQDGVLLDEIVRQQLPQINRIHYLDQDYPFSESNLATAFDKLKDLEDFGLAANNAAIYQLLVMGLTLNKRYRATIKLMRSAILTGNGQKKIGSIWWPILSSTNHHSARLKNLMWCYLSMAFPSW
jgi:hypothetical protein